MRDMAQRFGEVLQEARDALEQETRHWIAEDEFSRGTEHPLYRCYRCGADPVQDDPRALVHEDGCDSLRLLRAAAALEPYIESTQVLVGLFEVKRS